MTDRVTINKLQRIAVERSIVWHGSARWSLSDWMTALAGEVGEAANIIKKLNRLRDGMEQSHVRDRGLDKAALLKKLAKEIGDIQCYLPLLAEAAGIDLEDTTVEVFNEISKELGAPQRL